MRRRSGGLLTSLLTGSSTAVFGNKANNRPFQVQLDPQWLAEGWNWYVGVNRGKLPDNEVRELLKGYGFPGDDVPVVRVSALGAINGDPKHLPTAQTASGHCGPQKCRSSCPG